MMVSQGERGFKRRWYTKVMNWYRDTPLFIPLFNEAVRPTMRAKYFLDRRIVNFYCAGKEAEMDAWFDKIKMFFGFSSIRGGTVFLSDMFMRELKNAHIEHEANVDDYWTYHKVLQDDQYALDYIRNFKRKDIYYRCDHSIDLYGEINPMIRIHCKAVKQVFPKAKLFHMVRDPRDVIRSIMAKEILGPKDPLGILIKPRSGDPYFEQWPQMTRFEKLCWQWQNDNKMMRANIDHYTRFEDMLSDYGYFKEKILDYLGLHIPQEIWERYVNKPRNATRRHRLASWQEWDKDQLRTLERICGEEMAHYDYERKA